jgi:hypothetical protein
VRLDGRFVNGEQYHLLNFLGTEWGKGQPRFPAELVAGYTRFVNAHDGVITWDVPVGKNGHIPAGGRNPSVHPGLAPGGIRS